MGCDGGTIPTRDELVRTKKKAEKVDRDVKDAAKWKYCAISQEALREPIVSCPLGRLYNKETVIQAMINKTIGEIETAKHIRSLKDLKDLIFTKNSAFDLKFVDKGDTFKDYNIAQFICPVVGLEMNGKYRFCFIWTCGCVVSERALKEVKSDVCHKCAKPYSLDDVVVIYGTDEEVAEYEKKLELKREQQKLDRKNKKSIKSDVATDDQPQSGKHKLDDTDKPSTSGFKVKLEIDDDHKADISGSKKSKKIKVEKKADVEKASVKSKSIQEDPSSSKVFKSLFTTSEVAKAQPRAHWVTYNPLYY